MKNNESILAAIGMASLFEPKEIDTDIPKKAHTPLKSIMPKKDWNRRQARNKMAKQSRAKNRA